MTREPPRKADISRPHPDHRHIRIFLNGVECSLVQAYDLDAGWVRYGVTDAQGRPVVDRTVGEFVQVRRTGDVGVEWIGGRAP